MQLNTVNSYIVVCICVCTGTVGGCGCLGRRHNMRTGCRRRYGTLLDNSVTPFSDGMERAKVAGQPSEDSLCAYRTATLEIQHSCFPPIPFPLFYFISICILCPKSLWCDQYWDRKAPSSLTSPHAWIKRGAWWERTSRKKHPGCSISASIHNRLGYVSINRILNSSTKIFQALNPIGFFSKVHSEDQYLFDLLDYLNCDNFCR